MVRFHAPFALAALLLLGTAPALAQEGAPADAAQERAAQAARMGSTKVDLADTGRHADLLVLHKIRTQLDQPGNLAFVDLASGNVVARVPVGREPHEVAVSGDGKWALVTNTGANAHAGNTLSLIDLAIRKESRRIDLGPLTSPHGVWYNGGRFYFTAEGAKAIAAYDPETDHILWLTGTGQDTSHNIVVSKDGTMIFTANRGSDTVSMFQLVGRPGTYNAWHVTAIPVCKSPQGLDLSPDGKELWAGCRGTGEMAVIDTATKTVSSTFQTNTPQIARVRFTPDGHRVLAAGIGRGELVIFDAASRRELKRLKLGDYAEGILVTPDGKRAYVGVTTNDTVAEIDLDRMEVARRLHTGLGPDGMAWIGAR